MALQIVYLTTREGDRRQTVQVAQLPDSLTSTLVSLDKD